MIPRKYLAPNNRKLNKVFSVSRSFNQQVKSLEEPSIFNYIRRGRQNSEGFGGGNRITK